VNDCHRVDVALGERSYAIHITPGIITEVGALAKGLIGRGKALIIADERVARPHGRRLLDGFKKAAVPATLVTFPRGETSKTLKQAERLWKECAKHRVERNDVLIALGGGVCGDLVGFVAACWMRGIRFVQVPSTLLAMVDSSVGGKTGINSAAGKNLIGAFKQPSLVVIDPELVATMDAREYRSGLGEVLKYGVIRDPSFFAWQEANATALAARDPAAVAHAVAVSCRIKADYVREDEFERSVRAHLNYGHTFAHALERETKYRRYHHGEAVGIGMRMAERLARNLGLLGDDELARRQDALLAAYRLPLAHACANPAALAKRLTAHCRLDKKVADGRMRFVLPTRVGAVEVREVDDMKAVEAAFLHGLKKK
jgi:3-dehydroquinate synthase